MAFSVWQAFITNESGDIIPLPTVEVRLESSGALATIYADAAGSAKANPFTGLANGFAQFYAAGGRYKITATDGVYTAEFRNVAIGEAQGYDVGTDTGNLLTIDDADARYPAAVQNNDSATTDPGPTNDSTEGYSVGSLWTNVASTPPEIFRATDVTPGAAVWVKTTLTIDELGSMALKNAGSAGTEYEDNDGNDAKFLAKNLFLVEIAGTSYTLTATDNGKMIRTTNASLVTITVPEDATEALPAGFQCIVERGGDGPVVIQPEGSDDLNAADDVYTLDTQYAAASVVKQASGQWWMTGALEALVAGGATVGQGLRWDGLGWEAYSPWLAVLDQGSVAAQNPAGTDTPMQVEFGAASGTPSDPAQIDAAGVVTINQAGQYCFQVQLQLERTGGTGVSLIHARFLLNGSQFGSTVSVELDNSSADLPVMLLSCTDSFSVADQITVEIMRDSSENNSGGLASKTVTAGWTAAPSAGILLKRAR